MDPTAPQWFVLNFVPLSSAHISTAQSIIDKFNHDRETPIDLFAPTFVKMVEINGKMQRKNISLTFHYIFVHGTLNDVKQLCSLSKGFSFIIDHAASAHSYLTISDHEMKSFKIIARAYGHSLPCYTLDEINPVEGDLIEVIDGDFAGLIGTYIPRKGSKTGNIILNVSQKFATIAYDIKARYVRILEFGQNSRRAYDQIDAIIPHLLKALRLFSKDIILTTQLTATLSVFTRRYELTRLDNPKIDAKLSALLVYANHLLGNAEGESAARSRFRKVCHTMTNPWTSALVALLTAVTSEDKALFDENYEKILTEANGKKLSTLQKNILLEYEYYSTSFS